MTIRVSIVEDDKSYRDVLSTILKGTPGFELVSTHASAEDALARLPVEKVDLVLVDLSFKRGAMDGVECVRRLRQARADLLLCVLTVHEDSERIFSSLRAGAKGYLLKKTSYAQLTEEMTELCQGGSPMSPAVARKVTQHFDQQPAQPGRLDTLTDREREVLDLLARALLYKQIAAQLGISEHTVRNHIRSIYDKLAVHSRAEATKLYFGR